MIQACAMAEYPGSLQLIDATASNFDRVMEGARKQVGRHSEERGPCYPSGSDNTAGIPG
jgi:hypothetical protein